MYSSMPYEELTKEICFSIFYEFFLKQKHKKNKEKKKKKKKKKGFICGSFEGASIEVHYSYNLLKAFFAPWYAILLP